MKLNKTPTEVYLRIHKYVKIENILLRVKEEITKEIEKYFDMTRNKTTTYRILWDAAKAVLTEELITVKIYKKEERYKVNNQPSTTNIRK